MKQFFATCVLFFSLVATQIIAQPFQLSRTTDAIIGGGLIAGEVYHNLYDHFVTDDEWDGEIFDKNDINLFDRVLMQDYNKALDTTSDVLSVAMPATAYAFGAYAVYKTHGIQDTLTQTVIFAEALLMSHTAAHIVKGLVLRTRPYMYYDIDEDPDDDWNRSFYSGHTTMAFAAATTASYTYSKWFPNASMRIPFIVTTYSLAALTGVLRIGAGCHFATDVLVGAATGTAIGFLVPWLHTISTDAVQVSLLGNGIAITMRL